MAEENKRSLDNILNTLLSHSVPEIKIEDAKNLLASAIFLDAREIKEYNVSHIKGAIFVGYKNFKISSIQNIPKDKKIIVYCSVGYRSEKVAEKLITKGFTNVWNLYGGIFQWKNYGYNIYNDSILTQSIHAYDKKWGSWLNSGIKVY